LPVYVTPRCLGVDDWAFRKGKTYGTILVDLERHQPVDLLPDRTAATLTAWLQAHPQVEIITRDRSTEYTRGASDGAPTAMQVADRWHLLQNLRQMLERLLNRLYPQLKPLPSVGVVKSPTTTQIVQPRTRLRLDPKDKEAIAASRARSQATYHEVQRLRKAGLSIRQIAHQLEIHRATVRKYFYAETFPERAKRQASPRMLDDYLPYLELRLQTGCENATQLWRELREQGYPGGCVQVRRWMCQRRQKVAPTTPRPYRDAVITAIAARGKQAECDELPSYKKLTWLLTRNPEDLAPSEVVTLRRICQDNRVEHAHQLVQQFQAVVRHRDPSALDTWLGACSTSDIADLITFAAGLRQDYTAVRAALTTFWSNGQVEGQVNRLKLVKRTMYGRASFDLLKRRVLAA
jgi:transposase